MIQTSEPPPDPRPMTSKVIDPLDLSAGKAFLDAIANKTTAETTALPKTPQAVISL